MKKYLLQIAFATLFISTSHAYYQAEQGRWLNRDPIEERGGFNVYGFVANRAVQTIDILGLEDTTDDAGRTCDKCKIENIYLYVNLKSMLSMKYQVINLIRKKTGEVMMSEEEVLEWVKENPDEIAQAYGKTLQPGHVFLGFGDGGVKQVHFSADVKNDHSYDGTHKGLVYRKDNSSFTHSKMYKTCPETYNLVKKYVSDARTNTPYYHWNAGKLKTANGHQLSNCIVFALDAINSAGLDISEFNSAKEPWDLALTISNGK